MDVEATVPCCNMNVDEEDANVILHEISEVKKDMHGCV